LNLIQTQDAENYAHDIAIEQRFEKLFENLITNKELQTLHEAMLYLF
jgi:hypothetical protein